MRRPGIVLSVALVLVAAVACTTDTDSRSPAGGRVTTVEAKDNRFDPQQIEIPVGTTVRWVNVGRNPHNVLQVRGDDFAVTTSKFGPGDVYSHRFDKPGTFAYWCSLHGSRTRGMVGKVVVGGAATSTSNPATGASTGARTIRVPADARTIQGAVDRARPGDLVLVSPGVYHEAVTIETDRIVLRGLDRNTTILDGDFRRDNGVKVVGASGVAVENLTARDFTVNGFFWTGATGYRGSYLTAYRNGDYGIYAFDSRKGQFDHSYASGSPDAGFYIGQCFPCDAVITDVISERNGLGYSGTNAGGNLVIVDSVFRLNRAGIVPNTLDSEELAPQRQATIVGNTVYDNNNRDTPAIDDALLAMGNGILVAGGNGNTIERNLVYDHDFTGIGVVVNVDERAWPPSGNRVSNNVVRDSRVADLALAPVEPDAGNCFAANTFITSAPIMIEQVAPCVGASAGDPAAGGLDLAQLVYRDKPPARDYRTATPPPTRQRSMPNPARAPARPATDVPVAVDVRRIRLPAP
jgi:plastocyanin